MSSAVAELEAGLNAMQNLKPPGVSGSRITTLTALCVNNVQVRWDFASYARARFDSMLTGTLLL